MCGPLGLIELTRVVLTDYGVSADDIHREVFFTGRAPTLQPRVEPGERDSEITFGLDGRSGTVTLPPAGSVLDAVLTVRPDAPFACRNGVCGTCRMRLIAGEVAMAQNFALEPPDIESGFRLGCQSVPRTPDLEIDFDS